MARTRLVVFSLVLSLLIIASPIILRIGSENISAAPDTHAWDGGGADAFAGTHANWVGDVAPVAGDSVIFDNSAGGGALPCTWNLSIALASFAINVGYTATISQSASFSVTSFSQVAGTFTGSASYTLTDSGDFIQSGGTITADALQVTMTGANKILTVIQRTLLITIDGSAIVTSAFITRQLVVNTGCTLTINGATGEVYLNDVAYVFTNLGTIAGTGTLVLWLYATGCTLSTGQYTIATLFLRERSGGGASSVFTLGSDLTSTGTVSIGSADATNTISLALSVSNYALSASVIAIGTRGILNGSASAITCSSFDSSVGTFNANKSNLIIIGIGTIKTANTNGAPHNLTISGTISSLSSVNVTNNLTIDAGKSLTMGSGKSLTFGNVSSAGSLSLSSDTYTPNPVINSGVIIQNGKRFNISGSSTTPLTGYGTFDGELALNGSTASSYQVQTGLPMGNLYFDRDTKINIDSTRYLQVVPASTEFVSASIKSIGTEQGTEARWTADSTGPVTYTLKLGPNQLYDIWIDHTTRIGAYQAGPDGIVQFTYNGPYSSHEFTISKSSGASSNIQASFEYSTDGNMVSFTDKSYGGASTYVWNFGDGTGSTQQSPTHKYYSSGTYAVSLTVYDSNGQSSIAKTNIKIILSPDNPIGRGDGGWDVFITPDLTISISAIGLLVGGAIMYVSAIFMPAIPIVTPKGRKILGAIMFIAGVGYFIFIDNSWWG